jgi:adenylosuccinate synthase
LQIVLLSGRIRAGKSTLAEALRNRYGARLIKTRELISARIPDAVTRGSLQEAGDQLDIETDGKWVSEELLKETHKSGGDQQLFIVDAIRKKSQIDHIRRAYGRAVVHVHLTAPEGTLDERLKGGNAKFADVATYGEAQQNPTEAHVDDLTTVADIVVDTRANRPEDVFVRVAGQLGFLYVAPSTYVDVLIGGQYGSEGKGHIAWHLAQDYDYLMRVGGPNAGHKVPSNTDIPGAEQAPATYHLLPSGSGINSHAKLVLGPGTVVALSTLREEIAALRLDDAGRLIIDEQVMIIEDSDVEFEMQTLKNTIASTAQGVGYASARRLMRHALGDVRLARDIEELRPYLAKTADVLDNAFSARSGARLFLEGTQGAGLSLFQGYYPHVTSRDTNVGGLLAEGGIAAARVRRVIMVVRSYPIRVQDPDTAGMTSGFMSNPLTWEEISKRSGHPLEYLQKLERTTTTNRERRVAEFDWVLFRRAVHLNAPTDIALTFADYLSPDNHDARRFELLSPETQRFVAELERVSGARVSMISTGFSTHSIIDRRTW